MIQYLNGICYNMTIKIISHCALNGLHVSQIEFMTKQQQQNCQPFEYEGFQVLTSQMVLFKILHLYNPVYLFIIVSRLLLDAFHWPHSEDFCSITKRGKNWRPPHVSFNGAFLYQNVKDVPLQIVVCNYRAPSVWTWLCSS